MPYIVTTSGISALGSVTVLSRRAFPTLEKAVARISERRHAKAGGALTCGNCIRDTWADIDGESGGTIGPLPDGTVIEVERVEWIDLAREVGHLEPPAFCADGAKRTIIDAFNARQAGEAVA